jgi:hypothetical protein
MNPPSVQLTSCTIDRNRKVHVPTLTVYCKRVWLAWDAKNVVTVSRGGAQDSSNLSMVRSGEVDGECRIAGLPLLVLGPEGKRGCCLMPHVRTKRNVASPFRSRQTAQLFQLFSRQLLIDSPPQADDAVLRDGWQYKGVAADARHLSAIEIIVS